MANSLKSSTWKLDDPNPNVPVKKGYVKVTSICWQGYANATDYCLIKDETGATIFESWADPNLLPIQTNWACPRWIRGLTLCTLGSGHVAVGIE